jgi:eukaryotic-like serine/threonine-protein kinase
MPEDRRQDVDRIAWEALVQDSALRSAYLDDACSGDAALRRDVEAELVARQGELEGFQESPPWTLEAPTLAVGERVGPYEVVEPPLRGGMGSVYRARDTRLGRSVALKVLGGSAEMTPAARDRFKREAQAIAALDHPNICALYDVGSARHDGPGGKTVDYLVMEYLHGQTLQHRLARGDGRAASPLSIDEALAYGIQIADALATAHEAGFVHRDLKPANIMLVPSGPGRGSTPQAKLLDFGLAKHLPVSGHQTDPTVSTELATTPGTVLGTLGYLSPEQARGEDVGARSDLFAFGTVLFEMLTGKPAFVRASAAETLAAVLTDDPPLPSTLNSAVPASFDAIVQKALDKDLELRYQSAAEVRADLKRAQRERAGQAPAPPKPARWRWAAAAVTLSAAAVLLFGTTGDVPDFEPLTLTPGRGVESEPAFAPDPNYVAYTAETDGNRDVFVLDRRNGASRNLSNHPADDYHPAWLHDGSDLLFVSDRSGEPSIWRMAVNGVSAAPMIQNAQDVAVSPDGRRLAFTRPVDGYGRVFVADLANLSTVRQLTFSGDGPGSHSQPAWSPDSERLAYTAHNQIWALTLSAARPYRLLSGVDFFTEPIWSTNGRDVYYTSSRGGGHSIWRLLVRPTLIDRLAVWRRQGPRQISRSTSDERQPTISRDGRLLAFSMLHEDAQLVLMALDAGRETTWGTQQPELFPALDPIGRRLYFTSRANSETNQLWAIALTAGRFTDTTQQLTTRRGTVSHPACSPDGKWVAYWVGDNEKSQIWVVPSGGGVETQITPGPHDSLPAWSTTGDRVVYVSKTKRTGNLWTIPVHNGRPAGAPSQLTQGPSDDDAPAWGGSNAGLVAFCRLSATVPNRRDVWTVRPDGTGEAPLTDEVWAERVAWDPVEPDSLLVAGRWEGRTSPIEVRRVGRWRGQRVPPFTPVRVSLPELADFSVTRDGRLFALSRYRPEGKLGMWTVRGRGRF